MNKNAFKVGDKVRLTNDNRYAYVKVGDIATVTSVEDHGCMLHCGPDYLRQHEGNKEGYHYFFFEGQFELVKEPTPMTNYNDKQIHGWNGGDCPVHPETVVGYWLRAGFAGEGTAKYWGWDHKDSDNDIIAFRVMKEYVEPREWWVWRDSRGRVNGMFNTKTTRDDVHFLAGDEIIHVREA